MRSLSKLKSSKSVIFCQLITHIEVVEIVEVIVEVMGVVDVMEVTLLFIEVTSLQKSKSLRVVPDSFFNPSFPKSTMSCTDGRMDGRTERHCNLLSCLETAKNHEWIVQ